MNAGDVAFSASSLLGPVGGLIGLAFGAGAAAGWSFAVRTVLKLTNKQFEELREESRRRDVECDRRITSLENELRDIRERERTGLRREAEQLRDSGYRLLHEGQERYEQSPQPPPGKQP